jgi:predicted solute-binding protein
MSEVYDPGGNAPIWERHRLGVFGFIGTEPLTAGLGTESFVRAAPVEMPHLLSEGIVEAGLVEAIDLLELPEDFMVIPGPAWSMHRHSLSVRMFARYHPDMVDTVYVDDNSRQAAALVRILWMLDYGRQVDIVPFAPECGDPPPDAQAAVILGDRPVAVPPICFDYQIDLVSRWYKHTNLPLPWAFWVTLRHEPDGPLADQLRRAARQGASCARAMARYMAREHDWPTDLAERELAVNSQYQTSLPLFDGLDELGHLASLFEIISTPYHARGA